MTEKLNTKYEVPYLAGYSKDGSTIYIDRRLPRYFSSSKGKIDLYKYLAVHELSEKVIEDKLGLTYQQSHHIATKIEREYLEHDGYDWKEYCNFLAPYIKSVAKEFTKIPPDLDLEPYEDSKDTKILSMIKKLHTS